MGQAPEDVRATLREEGHEGCFGCPNATLFAAVISSMANEGQSLAGATFEVAESLKGRYLDVDAPPEDLFVPLEDLQAEYRQKLHDITGPCVGWLDGAGSGVAPRPSLMCNSPESGDSKISIMAGKILEKLTKPFIKLSES